MKKGNIMLIQGYMVSQMNHWILYLIPLTLIGLCGFEKPVFLSWLLMSMVPMLYSTVRRRTNGFIIFVVTHLGAAALVFLLPVNGWLEKAMMMLIVIVYIIYSLYLRLKTEDRLEHCFHPCVSVVISGGGLLFQKYQGTQEWNEQYVYALILFLGLFMLHIYLEQYLYFLVVNDINKGRIPEKAMFRSGLKLVGGFVTAIVAVLFLTSGVGWVGQIATFLKNIFFWILHMLFKKQEQLSEEPVVGQNETQMGNNEAMQMEPGETFWLWLVLEKIYIAAVYIAVVAVLIWLVYTIVKFLYHKFHENVELWNKDPEEGGVVDIREKCEVERMKRNNKFSFSGFLSARERIRRIYKKEVWAGRLVVAEAGEPRLLERMTARECGRKLDKSSMAQAYEKARYSEEACTAEDVKMAKL